MVTSVFVSPSTGPLTFKHLSPARPYFSTEELNPSRLWSSPTCPLLIIRAHVPVLLMRTDKYSKARRSNPATDPCASVKLVHVLLPLLVGSSLGSTVNLSPVAEFPLEIFTQLLEMTLASTTTLCCRVCVMPGRQQSMMFRL